MRLKLVLLTTALAFGLGTPVALAEEAPVQDDLTVAGAGAGAADEGAAEQSPASPDESGEAPQESPPPAEDAE
jgi:hypothetical protein